MIIDVTEPSVFATVGLPGPGKTTWVTRNEDKPHRCPECHRIPDRCRKRWGPRTAASCALCGVKWRMGSRSTGSHAQWLDRWEQRQIQWYGTLDRYHSVLLYRVENERHAT